MGVELNLWDKAPYFFINGDLFQEIIDTIDYELSYEVPDAEYTDAWKNNEWDGRDRLLYFTGDGTPFFPVGLLNEVVEILDMFKVDYEVTGLVYPGKGDIGMSWNTDKTLREYQADAVNEAISRGSGMIVVPTGGGKTLIGIYISQVLQHRTLVLCHRTEIADQWAERMEEILDVDVARFYDGDHEQGDVMVALYQSVYDSDEGEVKEGVDLDHEVVHFDESHSLGARTFSSIALSVSGSYRFGYTATPEREDNATLRVIGGTGPIIADLTAERLIDNGYLAKPEWDIVEAPSGGGRCPTWRDEYKQEIVKNDRRNQMIAQKAEEVKKPLMITVERIGHGKHLEAIIDDSTFVHGSSSSRAEDIQAFRDGEIPILIATRGIVGEGFDVPEIASFIVAGGMKSEISTIQQVGRALRPDTGTATIVDFWDKGVWVSDHSERRVRTYQDYYGKYAP